MMKRDRLNRRDFSKLSMAAFGGMVAGSAIGCNEQGGPPPGTKGAGKKAVGPDEEEEEGVAGESETAGDTHQISLLAEEPHVCRGLNTCAGKGKGGENECAGQGTCHTAAAHSCHEMNECKGQGGCGEYPGQNTCEGKGECAVPLGNNAWEKAREAFEKAMADAGNEVGEPPAEG